MPGQQPDDAAAGDRGFAQLFAVRRKLRSNLDLRPRLRARKQPLVLYVALQGQQGQACMRVEIGGRARNARALEVGRGSADHDGRLHQLAHDEALLLLVLAAPLAGAARADQDIDALVADLGRVIDAEQDEPDLRIALLKRRNGAQQHAPAQRRAKADLELAMQGGLDPESVNGLVEAPQHLRAIAIEASALGRQLQHARRSR